MMAGSNDAAWISQFNKRMSSYADDGILRGAYGWRWANPIFQIPHTISLLQKSPDTRQAVLAMWNPLYDGPLSTTSDRPCNTHIYFRVNENDELDMTVCNRSNDFVWGMMGTNVVHMTMLQEVMAAAAGYKLGMYHVFSNNCHIYTDLPRFTEVYNSVLAHDIYKGEGRCEDLMPILGSTTYEVFQGECEELLLGAATFDNEWLQNVAYPIKMAYLSKNNSQERWDWINRILAVDWHLVCHDWASRVAAKSKMN